jgi:hypothetical protein
MAQEERYRRKEFVTEKRGLDGRNLSPGRKE